MLSGPPRHGGRPPTPAFDARIVEALRQRASATPRDRSSHEPARAPRRVLVAAIAVAIALSGSIAAAWGQLGDDGVPPQPLPEERAAIAALDAPPDAAAEALGERLAENPFFAAFGARGAQIRAVGEPGGGLFAAPTDRGYVCLLSTAPAAATCLPERLLHQQPVVLVTRVATGGWRIAGLVPDGYETARLGSRTGPVERNGFRLEAESPEGEVIVDGDGVPTLRASIGSARPQSIP